MVSGGSQLSIDVKIADVENFEALVRLYYEFWSELRDKQGCRAEKIDEIRASVKCYLVDSKNAIFLAFVNGEAAGFVKVSERESCFWAEELYVKPNYRRMGVGKALMNHVERYVQERGENYIYAMVSPQNKSALLFLKTLGYDILNTIELVKPLEPTSEGDVRIIEFLASPYKIWRWSKEEYDDLEKEYLQVIEKFFRTGGTKDKLLQVVTEAIKDYLTKAN